MTDLELYRSDRSNERRAFEPKYDESNKAQQSLLSTAQLAFITHTSKSTWEKMRCRGEGPPYIKVRNLIWYRWSDVEAWLAAHEILNWEGV